ncbi:hypothetical protein [Faecalibacterium sp. I3-3-89]|uniref:hypothetical protein n=1 Tax=Faecalibacterium sp. I3-3-89 TaxID=2929493 RepID=UPI002014FA5E|nr:hypothetical protein [Faecalibacterium sp. I3-3-89]UQK43069.1 hypothetical protein MTP38_13500 [Faecalibacterium sp. I3-3-89]
MTQKRILSLLVSAALLCGLLVGCSDTSDDASHASSSASSPSSSSASSESAPSSTVQADTSGLFNKDFDENSLFSVDGTAAAFAPSLGWGPGVSGCSLKSVQAAATLLVWADEANLSARTDAAIEDAYTQWYDNLSDLEQEGFAEAWPMIKEDAAALLEDKDAMAGRLDDVGLEADKLTFSEKDWNALEEVVDPLVPEAKGEY